MPVPVYAEADIVTLKKMFAEYYTYEEIGDAIGRTPESVNQKIRKLGLKRNMGVSLLVYRNGRDILQYGDTTEKIIEGMEQAERVRKETAILDRKQLQEQAIIGLKFHLQHGVPRNRAIKIAHERGALLTQIGEVVGMTKQGVSHAIHPKVRNRRNFGL